MPGDNGFTTEWEKAVAVWQAAEAEYYRARIALRMGGGGGCGVDPERERAFEIATENLRRAKGRIDGVIAKAAKSRPNQPEKLIFRTLSIRSGLPERAPPTKCRRSQTEMSRLMLKF